MVDRSDARERLVEMATGFVRGKLLCAAVRLGIADVLSAPMSAADLATEIDTDAVALDRLCGRSRRSGSFKALLTVVTA